MALDTTVPDIQILPADVLQRIYSGESATYDWLETHSRLRDTLHTAANCESLIESEQNHLRRLRDDAKTDIERDARDFQIEYVAKHLTRAAELARKRLAHFSKLNTHAAVQAELKKCAADKHYWFEYYAWGYDPRARTPLSVVPFELFPKQKEFIDWLDDLVFYRRSSGLVEKSRDEGATETSVRWGIHNWRFREGFSMLLSSRTEDEVDTKKKQGTLFERARFQIRLLPEWMLPKGFDIDKDLLPDKLIANPNGNALIGQAPVENMGRGDRVTCALFDEFAFWRFAGYPQFRSMSQTTDSILMPSSVAGRLNQYADVAFDGVTPKFIMDWRDNPMKDKRWYDALPFGYISPKMTRTTIAQEVDRDYEAAQPGKVWYCPEPQVFITLDEFLLPFQQAEMEHRFFDTETKKFKIPDDWRATRTHDYGQSEGHEWAYLIGFQPREIYPLHDTHFVFVATNLEPTGLNTEQAVRQWRAFEQELGLRDSKNQWKGRQPMSYHSHEQDELRTVLLGTYGETWLAWNTDYETGIATIEDWWTPIENDKPNPFRPVLNGRCRLVFVAIPQSGSGDEYQLAFNERLNQYFVTTSQTERGFATLRKQVAAYHYPESELGKAVKVMRPVKEFDDIVDSLRGYSVNWNRTAAPLTPEEKIYTAMPERFQATPEQPLDDILSQQKQVWLQSQMKELGHKQREKEARRTHGINAFLGARGRKF